MRAKHTPGPWFAKAGFCEGQGEYSINSKGLYIAETIGGLEDGEEEANARLIAAAPDLLEVCERLRDLDLTGADDSLVRIIVLAYQNLAKPAIALATGKGPE